LDAYHYYKAFGTNPEPLVRKTELRGTVDRTHWYIRAKYSNMFVFEKWRSLNIENSKIRYQNETRSKTLV
ncbi:MAG: hypothetical protein LBQ97_03175, partial [Fusobacteriaceae bacterium]|nr:hypothetical protein [Fusobacteriaceae bacterium]